MGMVATADARMRPQHCYDKEQKIQQAYGSNAGWRKSQHQTPAGSRASSRRGPRNPRPPAEDTDVLTVALESLFSYEDPRRTAAERDDFMDKADWGALAAPPGGTVDMLRTCRLDTPKAESSDPAVSQEELPPAPRTAFEPSRPTSPIVEQMPDVPSEQSIKKLHDPGVAAGGRGSSRGWWEHEEDQGPSGSWWRGGLRIGEGSYGRVCKALHDKTGDVFVVKQATASRDEDPSKDEALLRELDLVQGLRHPNIVCYLGHEYVNGHLCICLEYCAGGSLRSMVDEFGPLDGGLLQKATCGILNGLNYLHTHDPVVVHRDLKGANVLMDRNFLPKLADFGCSKMCNDSLSGSLSYSVVGSFPWMAPEMITAEPSQKRGAGRKADVWSFSCVVLEMAAATNPWGEGAIRNGLQAYSIIGRSDRTPPIPDKMPTLGHDFVRACLQREPRMRPDCWDLLGHPWMQPEHSSTVD